MFQLINPIWLFAIAALSIPVIIHLWNIRPGKVLKVGSIAFIEASSRKSSRSFNLMDILLLLLRCLLLVLLAILLAQPFWTQLTKPVKQKGWVLIPRQNVHQVYTQFKPRIDSLAKAGYELHYFNPGFAAIDTLKFKKLADSGKTTVKNWELLKQLSQHAPVNLPLYVFTPNLLNSIEGTKPELSLNLHIQTFTPADSTVKWIQSAALISTGDAVKITGGNSKPSGTTFTNTIVQSAEQRNSAYQININNGQPSVSFKGDTVNKPVAVDTATMRIAIYSDKNTDANYLLAALTSIKQFTQRKIEIVKIANADKIPANLNWLFWLSEQPVPTSAKAKLFFYEPGKGQFIHSWINNSGEKIALSRHILTQGSPAEIIWSDGFGKPVLSLDADGKIYHFSTHFDPAWSDLVWSEAFPKMIMSLIIDEDKTIINDKRVADAQQISPRISNEKAAVSESKLTHKTDLAKAFWLALVIVFLTERWLAHRTKSAENNG